MNDIRYYLAWYFHLLALNTITFTLKLTPPIVKLRGIPTVFGSGYQPVHLTLYSLPTCFAVHDSFVIGPVNTHLIFGKTIF